MRMVACQREWRQEGAAAAAGSLMLSGVMEKRVRRIRLARRLVKVTSCLCRECT